MMQEHITLLKEERAMREGGATREEVLDHLQKEKALEEKSANGHAPATADDALRLETVSREHAHRNSLQERYRQIAEEESRTADPEKKLSLFEESASVLRKLNNLAFHELSVAKEWESSSKDPQMGEVRSKMGDILDNELAQIQKQANENTDPGILAHLRTRSAELEKMKAELEIRWIEKKMYDLHVGWSSEKEALSRELDTAKERLNITIREYPSVLKDERAVLLEKNGTFERSTRLGYVNGRLVEHESKRTLREKI